MDLARHFIAGKDECNFTNSSASNKCPCAVAVLDAIKEYASRTEIDAVSIMRIGDVQEVRRPKFSPLALLACCCMWKLAYGLIGQVQSNDFYSSIVTFISSILRNNFVSSLDQQLLNRGLARRVSCIRNNSKPEECRLFSFPDRFECPSRRRLLRSIKRRKRCGEKHTGQTASYLPCTTIVGMCRLYTHQQE